MNKIKYVLITMLFCSGVVYGQTVPNIPYNFQNLDSVAPVGQFVVGNGYNMLNAPFGDTGYWNVLSMRHENPGNNYVTQIAGEFFGPRLAFRNNNSGSNKQWSEIYHSGNIPTLKTALGIDPNVLIGLDGPALGVNIKANWSNLTGDWARGFTISDQNANSFFGIGVYGNANNGAANMGRGWIGESYSNSFMNFLPNGDVGIGTTTPKEKLSVNGKIRAKEIKIEAANWPDYVFKPEYQLNTLPELEAYIKANGHLPEVPAAAEVEKEGVALGEMNKILLKKIEELTLHLIELKKEVEKLKKK
ncbi:hypothetical protein [Pedobacter sp.]|uniref:hypothetical protein n=1 Tax=Pedobacter sp. TaxID=1411316 RepID=UPI0031DA6941